MLSPPAVAVGYVIHVILLWISGMAVFWCVSVCAFVCLRCTNTDLHAACRSLPVATATIAACWWPTQQPLRRGVIIAAVLRNNCHHRDHYSRSCCYRSSSYRHHRRDVSIAVADADWGRWSRRSSASSRSPIAAVRCNWLFLLGPCVPPQLLIAATAATGSSAPRLLCAGC